MTMPDSPDDQAAHWYARLQADKAGGQPGFEAWLARSPAHRQAWQRITQIGDLLDAARNDDEIRSMVRDALATPSVAKRRNRRLLAGMAVAAMLVGGSTAALLWHPGGQPVAQVAAFQDYRTGIGEKRIVTLPDGTTMTLDAASAVRVYPPAATRRLAVIAGRAFFQVAKDAAHPFIVSAAGSRITALGTRFGVTTAPASLSVALLEGAVRVDPPANARSLLLRPGDTVTVSRDGAHLTRDETENKTSWLRDQLIFENRPLSEVVEELAHYSRRKIILADPGLGAKRFSGVLRTDGIDALGQALEAYHVARPDVQADGTLVLRSYS